MQYFITLTILFTLLHSTAMWQSHQNLTTILQNKLPFNLNNFIAAATYYQNIIVIYGGQIERNISNSTFIIYLQNNTGQQLVTDTKPQNIINACGIIFQDAFYLYGTKKTLQNNTTPANQFWVLNLTTKTWTLINNNMQYMGYCFLQIFQTNLLLLFGASSSGMLQVKSYDTNTMNTTIFTSIAVNFTSAAVVEVQQWDGAILNVTIPIQMAPSNATSFVYSSFPILQRSEFQIINSRDQQKKFMQLNGRFYQITFNKSMKQVNINYRWWNDKFSSQKLIASVSSDDVTIFCYYFRISTSDTIYMEYKKKQLGRSFRVDSNTANFYSNVWPYWPLVGKTKSISLLITTQDYNTSYSQIILIKHSTLQAFVLHQDVYLGSKPDNVLTSTFGLSQCKKGFRGPHCNETVCPNSLYINSADKLRVLQFECSGHGKCSNGSCNCDDFWGGQDCSIYLRKSCQGQRIRNFPLQNCECPSAKIGGNDCTVKFCPNDCTGHGSCLDGICSCNKNYYGADCSIMIIDFTS